MVKEKTGNPQADWPSPQQMSGPVEMGTPWSKKDWLLLLLKIIAAPFLFVMACFPLGMTVDPLFAFITGGVIIVVFFWLKNSKAIYLLASIALLGALIALYIFGIV